ncbi:glycosyltransferase [Acidobacteria bacterium AB60]|nr:glycosyltransferase [Acidobacteria bacterium AB60]
MAIAREFAARPESGAPEKWWSALKILHIIASLSPAGGGPPEAVRQLVKAYLLVGAEIEVVCLDDPQAAYLKGIPVPVHALGQSYLGRYALSPRLLQWLHENAGRFDGIVVNGIWTFPGVAARLAARKVARPYGVFVHGALDPWFNKTYPLKHLKKWLYWPIQHAVLHDAQAVFFTTESERDLARQSFKKSEWKSVVVPYGINDPEEQRPDRLAQTEAFLKLAPQLRGRRYLLFLARIHEKKGCDLLLEAFARIASQAPDLDLVIAGPDQDGLQSKLKRIAAERRIAGRVHWPGFLGGDLKWGAIRMCEAFVLPSHQENFGIAVVEALAAGRPVLISDQVNIWQEIESDRAGLVKRDTLEGTEELLQEWLAVPEGERGAMGIRARSTFLKRYTMTRAATAINEVFFVARKESAIAVR